MKTINISKEKKARFIAHHEAIINGYNEVLGIWGTVLDVASEMNGKIYNKRFNEIVNDKAAAKFGRVFVSDPYNLGKEISVFINSRCYQDNGSCGWNYIDKELYYTNIKLETILEGGRISAVKAKEVITSHIGRINERLCIHKDAVKNYDKNVTKRAKALIGLANAFGGLNELFRPREVHDYDWEKMLKYNDAI